MPHEFGESLKRGKRWERWFGVWAESLPGEPEFDPVESLQADKGGTDGILQYRVNVQVKGDERAHETGNIFVEIYSVVEEEKDGWAVKPGTAKWLYYLVPGRGIVFKVRPSALADNVNDWCFRFGWKDADNGSYRTRGIPVPIPVFGRVAAKTFWSQRLKREFLQARAA